MTLFRCTLLLALLAAVSPLSHAHKRWFMPTDFALSDAETVTVDFTASNNIFFVDTGMPLAPVHVTSPAGTDTPLLNPQEGKRRSSFDIEVGEPGTYRVFAAGPPMYFVSYRVPGQAEPQRGRGALAQLRAGIPAGATEVEFAESHSLIETYITLGAESVPKPATGPGGLSLQVQDFHPSALYTDESARFVFLLDGKPVSGLTVTAQAEGSRYRDEQQEQHYVTAEDGSVEISWPQAGRYLLEAGMEQKLAEGDIATRYFSYFLTLEVMAP